MPACRRCLTEDQPLNKFGKCPDCEKVEERLAAVADKVPETPVGEVSEATEVPQFANYEEMLEFLKNKKSVDETSLTTKKKSGSKKRAPADKDSASKLAGSVEDKSLVWQTIHFYTRRADSFNDTLKDARGEAEIRNNNVLVFAHSHNYDESCNDKCRRV